MVVGPSRRNPSLTLMIMELARRWCWRPLWAHFRTFQSASARGLRANQSHVGCLFVPTFSIPPLTAFSHIIVGHAGGPQAMATWPPMSSTASTVIPPYTIILYID
ncbi:hypothetical protein BDQ94DRAFT_153191 [Aspergillus welwitschiae]|uniref:Uncharacterized protein n=1 Tax=Aspergillus welwitschiae TaxID=1341132 RepID=A0A3F3PLP8_9EURO|nr:hypothetical protein BDQ94DRAFT_153191 [Aspergillus welwitschiae]RDH27844.1 hypothetical protein BDQ94DRAFT_153191 [Aspergillus welwitschiae]